MAIKIICDICKEEVEDKEFMFDATMVEIVTAIDGKSLDTRKSQTQRKINLCRKCYTDKIEPLLK